jgi:anti-sigma factor RsiW
MALLTKDIHKTTKEDLSAYLDGELSAKDAAAVKQHLAACGACAWEKQTLEQTRRLLAQVPRVAVPRSFALREAQVRAPQKAGFFAPARTLYLRGVTAVVGVLLSAILLGDAWLRPALMPAAAPVPASVTFDAQAVQATEVTSMTLKAAPAETPMPEATAVRAPAPSEGTPLPEPTTAPAVAGAASPAVEEGRGGGPEATPEVAVNGYGAREQGETHAPLWADLRLWRAAEGVLGALFVTLLGVTLAGWRKTARGM